MGLFEISEKIEKMIDLAASVAQAESEEEYREIEERVMAMRAEIEEDAEELQRERGKGKKC